MLMKPASKCLWAFLFFLFSCIQLFAQEKTVTGKIIDEQTKLPLQGVSINVKGTNKSVMTNDDGSFSISVPSSQSTLVFSYVGYGAKEIKVNNQSNLSLSLTPGIDKLNEVVVVGYGTKRRRDLTGSVTKIDASDVNVVATPSVASALQGRAAGVAVTTDSRPGAQPTIRVRGTGSINANNSPLIVLDGFPLENGNLNDINSNDIESIDVLKDASATAIYGSRGANGVIMVTTKKGVAGQNNVSVSSYYGVQTPARLVETINRDEFIKFINAGYLNQTNKPVFTDAHPAPDYNTDWQRASIRENASLQNHTLSFSGGTAKTKYLLSTGYFSQDGLLLKSGFKRYSLRTNLDHKVTNWLNVGTHLQLTHSAVDNNDGSLDNIFRWGWPVMPIKNEDGSWNYLRDYPYFGSYFEGNWNPVADANEKTDRTGTNRMIADVYAELKLGHHVSFRTNFGGDLSNAKHYVYATTLHTSGLTNGGNGMQEYAQNQQIITENVLTYDNTWGAHHLTLNGVYSYQYHVYEDLSVSGKGFTSDVTGYNDVSSAPVMGTPTSDKYSNKLISYTSRASYEYKNKYLLTVTGRYDGSSRFGVNNKWGFFPSVGAGWRIIEEDFMKSIPFITNLKLRGSYGITGNQEIGNYKSIATIPFNNKPDYYIFNNTNVMLADREGLGNPDLKWEKTAQMDAGLDLGFWNNRIDLTFDYYKRNTSDLLFTVPIPTTSGFSSILSNIGEVENRGVELTLNARVIDKGVKWSIGGNLTKNHNEIVSLYGDKTEIRGGDNNGLAQYLIVGQPVNGVWARKSDGIIKTQDEVDKAKALQPRAEIGGERYVDVNGDGKLNSSDNVFIGTTLPDYFYGFNTSLEFKKVTLDVYAQGASNMATMNTGYILFSENQLQNRIYLPTKYAYDRMWSETNPNGTFPRAGAHDVYFSDRTSGNRHYFIIKNIRLGYNINPSWFPNNFVKSMNVYVNAQNYISFANFRGYNPETGDDSQPFAKTLMFGLNLNF